MLVIGLLSVFLGLPSLASAATVLVEAEAGTGAGQVMQRSAASGQQTVWLHAGQTRTFPLAVTAAGSYALSLHYSNDNYGPLETVAVNVDGAPVGQFQAQDTGDWGYGWNVCLWSGSLNPVALSAGTHTVTATVSGGDGYGVELDALQAA
jgi:hypothetical protein